MSQDPQASRLLLGPEAKGLPELAKDALLRDGYFVSCRGAALYTLLGYPSPPLLLRLLCATRNTVLTAQVLWIMAELRVAAVVLFLAVFIFMGQQLRECVNRDGENAENVYDIVLILVLTTKLQFALQAMFADETTSSFVFGGLFPDLSSVSAFGGAVGLFCIMGALTFTFSRVSRCRDHS